jgi:hypothetical protein
MDFDRNGLELLAVEECLHLLGTRAIGRVLVSVQALPAAFPVNFALLGDDVVVRTNSGTKLDAAMRSAVVGFEVDEIDPVDHTGWSVLVVGPAQEVVDPAELAAVDRLPLRPWGPVEPDHVMRIRSELVSGRRLSLEARRRHHEMTDAPPPRQRGSGPAKAPTS